MEQQATTEKSKNRILRLCLAWGVTGGILILVCILGLYFNSPASEPARQALGLGSYFTPTPSPSPTPGPEMVALAFEEAVTPTPLAEDAPTPAPTATPSPTPAPTVHPLNGDVVMEGMNEPIVLDIQIQLMVLDYMDFDQPDTEYTEGIENAIENFQRRNDLEVTGVCDARTFTALFDENANTYAVALGDVSEEVLSIEERLSELGYLAETPDETYTEATVEAVERFRERNGLTVSKEIDAEAFEVLLGETPVANFFAVGDRSDAVETYQKRLYELGYLAGEPDGIFGAVTQAAVRRFQDAHGLVVDGCLGKSTTEILMSDAAQKFSFKSGMSGDDVKKIQQRLAHYNYMSSSSDTGYYGEVTTAAVKAFQSRNGLSSDGVVGYNTMVKLLSDSAKKAATSSSGGSSSGGSSSGSSSGGSSSGSSSGDSDTGTSGSTIDYGDGVEAFIAIAESKLGSKYVRGAKGPNSFDCSGFVYWCLNQAGVNQSYMTSIAWRSCTKYMRITSMSDLKRGDVLVFKGSSMSTGHVGIYLGNGKMIDAGSSKGKVVIRDSINTSYWTSHFLMAYRIWD
ncbi:MAG: peptidoglycan-binding protein [Clostridia bacterium]|nr:peptidoglycan-binding protein [Clostridia bacterium]